MLWHEAFLEQAKSDWKTYEAIQCLSLDVCQSLHYLQMATEKLGKAMLLAEGVEITRVRANHKAFVRFLQIAFRNSEVQEQLRMSSQQLRSSVKNLLPLAEEIEKLAPALAQDGPNAEYPWIDPSSSIRVPASFQFSTAYKLVDPAGRKLLQLTRLLLDQFYILFIPKRTK